MNKTKKSIIDWFYHGPLYLIFSWCVYNRQTHPNKCKFVNRMIRIVDRLEYLLAVLAVCGPSFLYSVQCTLYTICTYSMRFWEGRKILDYNRDITLSAIKTVCHHRASFRHCFKKFQPNYFKHIKLKELLRQLNWNICLVYRSGNFTHVRFP